MRPLRGMSLVDVIIGTALVLIVFIVLLGLLRASLLIASSSKAKAGATAVATTQIEYLRSLPYESVGTIGGIPAGPVPQYATTTMNGVPYGVRTLVQYVDDPKDGSGASDSNGITTDYKRIRVAASYIFRGEEREIAIVSTMVPQSIESTTGGGTIRIQAVDALGAAVPGASVRIYNPSLSPSVDVTTFTDSTGAVIMPGAPTSTGYRITVSKDGYSTAETYARDATNQNPTPGYLTVAANQTTTSTFAIDVLASFTVRTFFAEQATSTVDTFDSAARLLDMVNVSHEIGTIILSQDGMGYFVSSGSFRSVPITPPYLVRWTTASFTSQVSSKNMSALIRVLDASGTPLPDSVLPGNSTGFSTSPISLSGVSTTTYPSLSLGATLSTNQPLFTPTLLDWSLSSVVGPIPAGNVPFTLTGAKRKGTTASSAPIFKTVLATSTNASGSNTLSLEWDVYSLVIGTGFTFTTSTPATPFIVEPGTTQSATVIVQ